MKSKLFGRCKHGLDKYGRFETDELVEAWGEASWTDEEGRSHQQINVLCRCGAGVWGIDTWISADRTVAHF